MSLFMSLPMSGTTTRCRRDFLRLLLQSGKMVVVCLMKMRETDAPAFVAHFQRAVLDQMPARTVATLTVPQLTRAQLVNPNRNAPTFRVPIVNQIFVLGGPDRGCPAAHGPGGDGLSDQPSAASSERGPRRFDRPGRLAASGARRADRVRCPLSPGISDDRTISPLR